MPDRETTIPRVPPRARTASREPGVYGWRTTGRPPVLDRMGRSPWVGALLLDLFVLGAVLAVAVSWLAPAIGVVMTRGWSAPLDGGPARAALLSGPAWAYVVIGLVFLLMAAFGVAHVVGETRRRRRPAPILRLAPDTLTLTTRRDVSHDSPARARRMLDVPTVIDWEHIEGIERSTDDDVRPTLVVDRPAAERLGLPLGAEDAVLIRFRGEARDVPVLEYFLAERRARRQLGSPESLRLARQLSGEG